MISLDNITKIYNDGTKALRGVNLTLPDKGLVFIVGKSGSGKSTLLNIIGGIDLPTGGTLTVDGKEFRATVAKDADAYRNSYVGYVYQDFNLIENYTVYENVELAMHLNAREADLNLIEDALQAVDLSGLGYRKIAELSGGQKQRTAIARALIKKPSVILADEPTGALDSETGEEIVHTLAHVARKRLVLVVTHDNDIAERFGDRIITIADGKIVADVTRTSKEEAFDVLTDNLVAVERGKTAGETVKKMVESLPDGETYIGISKSAEHTALAFPEVTDKLLSKKNKNDFVPLPLKKSGEAVEFTRKYQAKPCKLAYKDSLATAWKNVKTRKGKFIFMCIVCVIAMAFLSTSIFVSMISTSRISANCITTSSDHVAVIQHSDQRSIFDIFSYFSGEEVLTDEDLQVARDNGLNPLPVLAHSLEYEKGVNTYGNSYFTSFNYIAETNDLSEFGFTARYGSLRPQSASEIVISDAAAYYLMLDGFFGKMNGVSGIWYPEKMEDIVNAELYIANIDRFLTIVGVFKTGYEEYSDFLTSSPYEIDLSLLLGGKQEAFSSYTSQFYSVMVGGEGFADLYLDRISFGTLCSYVTLLFKDNATEKHYGYLDLYGDDFIPYEDGKGFLEYEDCVLYGSLPETLQENELVLTLRQFLDAFYDCYYESGVFAPPSLTGESFMTYDCFDEIVSNENNTLTVSIPVQPGSYSQAYYSAFNEIKIENAKIVAIVDYYHGFCSNELLQKAKETGFKSPMRALAYVDGSVTSIASKFDEMQKSDVAAGTLLASVSTISSIISTFVTVFRVIAIIALVVCFVQILTFSANNVKERSKEIGIIRALGASKADVYKIFSGQAVILSAIVSVFSLIISSRLVNSLNETFESFKIINFGISEILFIVVLTFVFVTVATLIPVVKIARRHPAEAIRRL